MKSSKAAKTKYGKKDLLKETDLDPKNHKVRITSFIDGDLLVELKTRAEQQGTKYQTLLNQLLRQALNDTESMAERLKRLEDAVFRKSAG
jgi:predicted DNA binding CopG/RHH family protein